MGRFFSRCVPQRPPNWMFAGRGMDNITNHMEDSPIRFSLIEVCRYPEFARRWTAAKNPVLTALNSWKSAWLVTGDNGSILSS
jgi:hypothetical protein